MQYCVFAVAFLTVQNCVYNMQGLRFSQLWKCHWSRLITSCRLLSGYQCFGGTCWLNLQSLAKACFHSFRVQDASMTCSGRNYFPYSCYWGWAQFLCFPWWSGQCAWIFWPESWFSAVGCNGLISHGWLNGMVVMDELALFCDPGHNWNCSFIIVHHPTLAGDAVHSWCF